MPSGLSEGLEIQLQEADYGDGTIKTEKGGIIKGKDFSLQARVIEYTRKGEADSLVHKVEAKDQLFVVYKGRAYKGDRAVLDVPSGTLTVWNGCTQIGLLFVGGGRIEIFAEGNGVISDAYVTTSENERSDWMAKASRAEVTKESELKASNVRFYFVRAPIFWVPYFSTDMLDFDGLPLRCRVRWGGREGFRIGLSRIIKAGNWGHRALVDYGVKNGFGAGLRSRYRGKDDSTRFDALNYVAQGENKTWGSPRHHFQGRYRTYIESANVHVKAQYDKLSDKRMKYDFSDHAVSDVRAGLTQMNMWKEEANWKANLGACVRVNSFQNIKQKLPLLTYNYRSRPLGSSPLLLSTKVSAGFLDYVYAKEVPSVRNFHSSRSEVSQKLFMNKQASIFSITPFAGYTLIHYSNSPQNASRLQAVGKVGIAANTRFVRNGESCQQILEPYVDGYMLTRPPVQTSKNYIFGLDDAWVRINELKYGLKHNIYLNAQKDGFVPKLRFDLYFRSFYATQHLSKDPYKIWLSAVWDATSRSAFKIESAWNIRYHCLDHLNAQMRQTFSEQLALILEWRQRGRYAWRKLDSENFIVEAARSVRNLKSSQMSDDRKTVLAALAWTPLPTFDLKFASWCGWRPVRPKRYVNYELDATALVRGALRVTLSLQWRPGGRGNGWNISFDLGPRKETSSTSFKKIGQGAYDMW